METSRMINIIVRAIKRIKSERLFNSERAYRGELKSRLDQVLREQHHLPNKSIVEEEYQKTIPKHGIKHRPDIIYHIPFEEGVIRSRREGNFIAFELKMCATEAEAQKDLDKLNDYVNILDYPLAMFVNIDSEESFIELVQNEKIHVLNVVRDGQNIEVKHSYLRNGEVVQESL